MTKTQAQEKIVEYWLSKGEEALASAHSELGQKRLSFAMNRAYYACFYAASAVLLKEGHRFSKHSGVRAALHQYLVKSGRLSVELGKSYDRLFENRQEGDYIELIQFEREQVEVSIQEALEFVKEMKRLVV